MKKQKDSAGGWGALHSSNHFLFRERITTKALALYKMNKPGGFDCPGCAWGDPDEPSLFEICENGVKAFSYEATSKKADPHFFSQHTLLALQINMKPLLGRRPSSRSQRNSKHLNIPTRPFFILRAEPVTKQLFFTNFWGAPSARTIFPIALTSVTSLAGWV